MINPEDIELVPGIKGKPVFNSPKECEEFWRDFYKDVAPELEKQRIKRAESELEAFFRIVN